MSACRAEVIEKYGASFINICSAMHEFFYPEYFLNFNQDAKTDKQSSRAGGFASADFIGGSAAVKYMLKYGTLNVIFFFALFYAVIFSALWGWNQWDIASAESAKKEIGILTKELESGEARKNREIIENDYNAYLKKINSKEVIEFKKYSLDKIMLKISNCIPNDVSIKNLNFINDAGPLISIAGITNSYESAINFSEALKKGEKAPGVSVKKIDQLENRVEFQFEIALNGEAQK
jgi:Tfp pilus assembly protein PilN